MTEFSGTEESAVTIRQGVVSLWAKEIYRNLLFDSVDSCLLQVEKFEERKAS